uniref:Putative effector protein n=1 Tax=Heterodera avenae TaxID=34510 RepID=A0A2L0VDL1_HETAV|nr:putative effector protein [Heterodera avenae]
MMLFLRPFSSPVSAFAVLSLFLFVPAVFSSNRHHSVGHHFDQPYFGHSSDSPPNGHHRRHQQNEHQMGEHTSHKSQPAAAGVSPNVVPCACAGHSAEGSRWMNEMPAHGMPLFLFPDNVLRLVDVVLRSENAFHRDNADLARHLFHLLAHQFPRKWFIVGVGTMPAKGARKPPMWAAEEVDVLNGTVQLQSPPGYGSFPFFDGRHFKRENGSQLWYFVNAMEPIASKATEESPRKNLAKCVSKKGCSSLVEFASVCAHNDRPLGMAVKFSKNLEMSIFASEPLTMDTGTLVLTKEAKECVENERDEERGEQQQHILVVAAPEGEKE